MYSIRILWVGKTQESYLKTGLEHYFKKLKPYVTTEVIELKPANYAAEPRAVCQKKETQQLLQKLTPQETVFFLEEQGASMTSVQLANSLEKLKETQPYHVTFVIGGAFGFDKSLIPKQAKRLCLSQMTFTHQMVRLILLEQLYRAFTIINGQSYHH